MQCRMRDLRCKEVINISDGCRLGFVSDVDIRIPEGQVIAIVVNGPCRFSGCSAGERNFTFPGNASSGSETISSSSTSPSSGGNRDRIARGAGSSEAGKNPWDFLEYSHIFWKLYLHC